MCIKWLKLGNHYQFKFTMLSKHLITGVTGQDGVFLTSAILNDNPNDLIFGLSRNKNHNIFLDKVKNYLAIEESLNNIKILDINLLNSVEVKNLILDITPKYIYNLTGPSSVYESLQEGSTAYNDIINIFNNLSSPLVESGLESNFFQASSSEMFDVSTSPLNEISKLKARSPYAKAKLSVHKKVQELKVNSQLNISSGIMFNHESEFRADQYLIMKIINSIIKIKSGEIENFQVGSLELTRDWSYAKDVASAIYNMNKNDDSQDYVIGSGTGSSIKNILSIVFEYFDLDWQQYVLVNDSLLRPGDPLSIVSDPKKIQTELGWETNTTLEEMLIKCIEFKVNKSTL